MRKQSLAPYTVLISLASLVLLLVGACNTVHARHGGRGGGRGRMTRVHHGGGRRTHRHGGRGWRRRGGGAYVYPGGYYGGYGPWLDDYDYDDGYYDYGPGFGIYFGV